MQIKRFEARDMTEALKMIKNEFGSQAVILSAKTLKKSSGLFGAVRKAGVEITAASDQYRSIDFKEQKTLESKDNFQDGNIQNSLMPEDKVTVLKKHNTEDKESEYNQLTIEPSNFESSIIKKLRLNLKEQGVEDAIAEKIVGYVKSETRSKSSISMEEVKNAFRHIIGESIVISEQIEKLKNKAKIVAFVGPTGVGKTTTIAKLSVQNALEKKYSVALISMDYQRVGATVTLEKYAKIIGLPYTTADSEKELIRAVDNFSSSHLVFIDTPGIALKDSDKIIKLSKQLAAVSPDEVHLLLSATTKDKDMMRLCQTYKLCGTNCLLFTKIDETSGFGNLINLVEREKTPLSYITNGQQIPEDITRAVPISIADMFFNSIYNQNSQEDNLSINNKREMNAHQSSFLSPGEYFVANKNSDIFHHRNCKAVDRININNIIVFHSMTDAKRQRFKPCRMCCNDKIGSDRLVQRFKQNAAVSH